MNKYITLMLIFLYLVIITITVGSIGMTTTTEIVGGIPTEQSASILSIFGFIGTFFRILSFSIPEIPEWITFIFFYPVIMVLVYMIVDILKDLVPFT